MYRTGTATSPGSPASAPGQALPADQEPLTLGPRGLAALYAGTRVTTLRRTGLASGGSPAADAALDGAYMLDAF